MPWAVTKATLEMVALVSGGVGGMLCVHFLGELALMHLGPEAPALQPMGGGNLTPLMLISAVLGFPVGFAVSWSVLLWAAERLISRRAADE